jgi:benzoyl-CoA reductase/2-hydroxyglutaryl-CoA dehydratase subunit BcrC/BadD/HgdB
MNEKTIMDKYFQESARDEDGANKIGWFCTYAPEELIISGGFEPVRFMGEKELKTSESYFPINFCPYLKSGWESLLKYGDKLSAAVFTNSCDGMRRFYDIAEHHLKDVPIFMLDVPRNTYPDSINFYSLQLKKMLAFIENIKGSAIDDKDLLDAILLCDRKRAGLKEISRAFLSGEGSLSIPDYYQLMELSATASPEKFLKDMDTFTERSPQGNDAVNSSPKVMVVGNFITEDKLWDMLQELDISIVADDLCISNRYYEDLVEADGSSSRKEMLDLLAKRYLGKPACMRMADTGLKLEEIMTKVRDNGVQGVIFISLKFCDTMLYSFPLIRKELAKLGIPVLYLEIEYNNFSEGQIKTRMQAFLEML